MENTLDVDKLLKCAGDSGVYQVTTFALIGIVVFFSVESFAINFIAGKMDHWCQVPGLQSYSYEEQLNVGIPLEDIGGGQQRHSRCHQYSLDFEQYTRQEIMHWNRTLVAANLTKDDWTQCSNWTYDQSVFISSAVSEWNLVCDWSWLVDLISTVFMAGRLVACLACGLISDRFGRKPAVLGFHGIKTVGLVMSLYAPNYSIFVMSRFLIAFGATGSTLAVFVILSEVSGEKRRHVFGIGWTLFMTVGIVIFPGVSYLVRDFHKLQVIYTWPQFIPFIYILLLDESPRWLASRGRNKDAIKILQRIALINHRQLPDTSEVDYLKQGQSETRESSMCRILLEMVSTPTLRKRSFIVWLNWFTSALMYYALMLNTGYLPGDIFLNSFLLTVIEIPANFLTMYFLGRIGRRLTLGLSMIFGAISSVLMIPLMFFSGSGTETGITVLAIIGKGFITIAYSAIYVVTAEMYPTHIRNIGMGVSSSFGRLSGMGASFVGGYLSEL